jgi:succinate-semialdehyde dehydrogenase / glutarate-semialdehyde dehydrogenase
MSNYAVTNPATGRVEAEYPLATEAQLEASVSSAQAAFETWRGSAVEQRAALLARVAQAYEDRRDELAAIITREMGKPLFQAGIEVDIVASIYRYYATNGPGFLADEALPVAAGGEAVVSKEGLGVLLGIMPWNFPYYQVARFAAPNLMNGNTVLLKHAPQCPESALAMEEIFREAGAAEGTYVNVFASNEQVSTLIADDRVVGVSLTGSERAGAAVAAQAGAALKKVVLELGGSDAFIVLEDADVEQAVGHAILGRFGNTGQACNAAKRIIVVDAVADRFEAAYVAAVEGLSVGDPMEATTFLGPLSSAAARDGLDAQVRWALEQGAVALTGGAPLPGPGAFFAPTVLSGVTADMDAYHQELFGPVAVLHRVADADAAVALANDSSYGLGASVHSADVARARAIAERLEVGMVAINEPSGTAAELPFGGVKRSGFGRELGAEGMGEFVNRKLVRTAAIQGGVA